MMNISAIIIFLLALVLLFLTIHRFLLTISKDVRLGKCMTIGDREIQEDNIGTIEDKTGTLLVLADGMGKCHGGRIAGRIAVETFKDLFREYKAFEKPQYYFRKAFNAANRAILSKIADGRGSACVAAAMIKDNMLYYALVGNSRIAVYRGGDLVPVSDGHTIDVLARQRYMQGRLVKESAIALLESRRIYNFVGRDGFQDVEFFSQPIPLRVGDIVAIMSDGVYETLRWRELESELAKGKDCQRQALGIIQRVNRSKLPNKDNASIVLYRC